MTKNFRLPLYMNCIFSEKKNKHQYQNKRSNMKKKHKMHHTIIPLHLVHQGFTDPNDIFLYI